MSAIGIDEHFDPGAWGPRHTGGRTNRAWWRAGYVLASLSVAGVVASSAVGALLVRKAESGLTRVPVSALDAPLDDGGPLSVLVVGSDAREGLTEAQRRELTLGNFDGQRSDTTILVTIHPETETVSVVSFPRDLRVFDQDGRRRKLTETYVRGPDGLVDVVRSNFGLPVNHFVEVSITGFIGTVEVLGSVRICLDEPLVDRKSGADLRAGCQDLTPEQALAYVRSRQGPRGDFERIERQQQFMRAMLAQMVDARVLLDVPRLARVVEEVADNVVTDDGLTLGRMRRLAEELRGVASGSVPMVTVPAYTRRLDDGKDYVLPYWPGADALFAAIRAGEPLPDRGDAEARAETRVALWTGGRPAASAIVEGTINFAGYRASPAGTGPVDAGATTVVYVVPGAEEQAAWIAGLLGTRALPLPQGIEPPEGADVVDDISPQGLAVLEGTP
jgi:LCP family protein required for cell wall assembly